MQRTPGDDDAPDPDAGFDHAPGGASAWLVVAEAEDIGRAARESRIDVNALRPGDMADEAAVSFPSALCPDGTAFLSMLALLDQRGVPFRLYRTLDAPETRQHYRLRVFPEPGAETRMVLRAFHPAAAAGVADMQAAMRAAFDHLARLGPSEGME